MARLPRFFAEGQPLHIIQRGNNRDRIFAAEPDYLFFLDCLERAAREHDLAIHAYVLMTNHVHLLASPSHEESAPRTLQSLGRRYVQYFNYTYRRTGTLWEGRYRATVIDAEVYLLTCMRYIELNPVRANMVEHPGDYPWSSYRGNALGANDSLLSAHELYRRLGRSAEERRSSYRQLFRSQLSNADVEAIREATNKAWALGTKRFQAKVEALSHRRAAPRPRGRPAGKDA
ncbi:MAG TPA: transposase [Burkholderiales bacterium]|nr:transposase [Burkholderiales bacterium]